MNVVAWLYLTTSVVLQGLFPPSVDSPPVQSVENETAWNNSDDEADAEFEILGRLTSALADGFVRLITTLDPTEAEVKLSNETNVNTEDDFIYSIGRFFVSLCV